MNDFEAWARLRSMNIEHSEVKGGYLFQTTQDAWLIWQAARAPLEAEIAALPEKLANQRRTLCAETDTISAELKRVQEAAREEIEYRDKLLDVANVVHAENLEKIASLTLALEKAEKDAHEAKQIFVEVNELCHLICGSSPDQTIKGEIESRAFALGHFPEVLNAKA